MQVKVTRYIRHDLADCLVFIITVGIAKKRGNISEIAYLEKVLDTAMLAQVWLLK